MVSLPREICVLRQTNLTLVVAYDSGHDPIRATGLLFTHLGYIARNTTPDTSQVWQLTARDRPASDAWMSGNSDYWTGIEELGSVGKPACGGFRRRSGATSSGRTSTTQSKDIPPVRLRRVPIALSNDGYRCPTRPSRTLRAYPAPAHLRLRPRTLPSAPPRHDAHEHGQDSAIGEAAPASRSVLPARHPKPVCLLSLDRKKAAFMAGRAPYERQLELTAEHWATPTESRSTATRRSTGSRSSATRAGRRPAVEHEAALHARRSRIRLDDRNGESLFASRSRLRATPSDSSNHA